MPRDPNRSPDHGRLIVMVDDDAEDQYLAAEALTTLARPVRLLPLASGAELIDYLNRAGKFSALSAPPRPDLVLLDLNMPRMDGHETLRRLREDPAQQDLAVVVFSTSQAPSDVTRAYRNGANSYIVKPQSFDALCAILTTLAEYWFHTAVTSHARD